MKRHEPIKKWHVAITSRKLIDTTGNQLNYDTWDTKKKKRKKKIPINDPFLWTTPMDEGATDGVPKVCLTSSIKGHSWEGNEEIRRKEHAHPQYVRPSLIKDGWAYWFQAWTELVLSYVVRPWLRMDEHIEFSLNMLLDQSVRNNL